MWVSKPRLNPVAREALKELQAAGVEITPDVVLWVHDAATRIASHPPRPVSDLIDWPVPVGGVSLYPLSFGAAAWLSTLPDRFKDDIRFIAFACAHSRCPEVFDKIKGQVSFCVTTIKWISKLRCSMKALRAAIDQVLGVENDVFVSTTGEDSASEVHHWGAVVVALCRKFPGTTPDYWTWQVSRDKVHAILSELNAELPEENRVTEYEVEANTAFRAIVEHIKAGKNV